MTDTYEQTLDWLYRLEARKGMDFRLSRMDPVLDRLGHPERALTCVHVAGTNGKGSTSAMVEAALRAGGYRTGLYTSPHLVSFRERIRIGGKPVARREVVATVRDVRTAMEAARADLTFFEIVTLAALLVMRAKDVDVAVIEAGLGGRLDATNIVFGSVCAITSVGIDHAEYLGNTIEQIAAEKAGIVKRGSVLVTGALPAAAEDVIAEHVAATGVRWLAYERDFGAFVPMAHAQLSGRGLLGAHQQRNAAVAFTVLQQLPAHLAVNVVTAATAIVEAQWPGRLEVIPGTPPVLLDAAHNPEAAAVLAGALDDAPVAARPRVLLFAAMSDKDWPAMLKTLRPHFDRAVFTPLAMARAERPEHFVEHWPDGCLVATPDEGLALARKLAGSTGSVVIAGSIFLLGHLYRSAGGSLLEQGLSD